MRAIVRALCAAIVAVLAARQSMACGSAPRPVPTTTAMQVHVVGAEDVVITDPIGRQYPCRDSTCSSIPRCQAVTGFGTLPRGISGESVPKQIVFEIYGPSEGAYRIHAANGGESITISVDVSDSTMHCGKMDAIDGTRGVAHKWVVKWRRTHGGPPRCVLVLAREKTGSGR